MPIDYRLDPFQDVLNPVTITGETHTIPSVSPFTIRLDEVPLKETPSSISLTIGGVAAEEVSSAPAAGQFWPDYSTGADGDDDWNTGTILFNTADAGKTVVVTYKGTGSLVWAHETRQSFVITESQEVTAPPWARFIALSGCAGGGAGGATSGTAGGGGSSAWVDFALVAIEGEATYLVTIGAGGLGYVSSSNGGNGGATKFGDLLTIPGGGGGYGSGGGAGAAGALPSNVHGVAGSAGRGGSDGNGAGADSAISSGGAGRTTNGNGNNGTGYGSGGSGGRGSGYKGGNGAPGVLIGRWLR